MKTKTMKNILFSVLLSFNFNIFEKDIPMFQGSESEKKYRYSQDKKMQEIYKMRYFDRHFC